MAYVSDLINSSVDKVQSSVDARSSTSIRVVQVLGLSLAGYFAGTIGGASTLLVPTIKSAPKVQQAVLWEKAYTGGKAFIPGAQVAVASLFGWLAIKANHSFFPNLSLPFGRSISFTGAYSLAAILSAGVIPYTYFFLQGPNADLEDYAARTRSHVGDKAPVSVLTHADEDKLEDLLTIWQGRNALRAALAFTGSALGAWASINWPYWKKI